MMAVGVLAFVFSGRRNGSIEWHKQRYLAIANRETWIDRWWNLWDHVGGEVIWREQSEKAAKRMESHRQALVDLGYLKQHTLVVTGGVAATVAQKATALGMLRGLDRFSHIVPNETMHTITLIVPAEDIAQWQEMIAYFDVP